MAGRLNSFETTHLWIECGIPAAAPPGARSRLTRFGSGRVRSVWLPARGPRGGRGAAWRGMALISAFLPSPVPRRVSKTRSPKRAPQPDALAQSLSPAHAGQDTASQRKSPRRLKPDLILDGGFGQAYRREERIRMPVSLLGKEAWICKGRKELLMPIPYFTPS
jgi:hypothetical protein